ncbi:hypothetical protein T484DRAFT_1906956, partial [Baffinella frigidus]
MSFYNPPQQMRRSYEPPPPQQSFNQSNAAARAGVGLLFQTSSDGRIVVKEVVQGGSAWRGNVIKPTDVIVNVGQHNVQKQPLSNLRELILGEPGSFITLGFQRGGGPQYYDTKMMRGTPDFLDKHMSAPSKPQAQQSAIQAQQTSLQQQ